MQHIYKLFWDHSGSFKFVNILSAYSDTFKFLITGRMVSLFFLSARSVKKIIFILTARPVWKFDYIFPGLVGYGPYRPLTLTAAILKWLLTWITRFTKCIGWFVLQCFLRNQRSRICGVRIKNVIVQIPATDKILWNKNSTKEYVFKRAFLLNKIYNMNAKQCKAWFN